MTTPSPASPPPFRTVPDLIGEHARQAPARTALRCGDESLSYAELDILMDRVAAALHRDGVRPGQAVAICAASSLAYLAVFMGALRAGVAVAPLAPGSTAQALCAMVGDAQAQRLFADAATAALLAGRPACRRW